MENWKLMWKGSVFNDKLAFNLNGVWIWSLLFWLLLNWNQIYRSLKLTMSFKKTGLWFSLYDNNYWFRMGRAAFGWVIFSALQRRLSAELSIVHVAYSRTCYKWLFSKSVFDYGQQSHLLIKEKTSSVRLK